MDMVKRRAKHCMAHCTVHCIVHFITRFTLHSRLHKVLISTHLLLPPAPRRVELTYYEYTRVVRLRGQRPAHQVPGRATEAARGGGSAALLRRLRHALRPCDHPPLPPVPEGRLAHRRRARALPGRGGVS